MTATSFPRTSLDGQQTDGSSITRDGGERAAAASPNRKVHITKRQVIGGALGAAVVTVAGGAVIDTVQGINETARDAQSVEAAKEHGAAVAAFDELLSDSDGDVTYGTVRLRVIPGGATILRQDPKVALNFRSVPNIFRQPDLDSAGNSNIVEQFGNADNPNKSFANAMGATMSTVFELTDHKGNRVMGGFLPGQNSFNKPVTGEDIVSKAVFSSVTKIAGSPDYGATVTLSPDTNSIGVHFDEDAKKLVTDTGLEVGQINPINANPSLTASGAVETY